MCSCVAQCFLYVIVMIIEKGLMTALLLLDFWSHVRVLFRHTFLTNTCHENILYLKVLDLILSPIHDPNLEIVIVMFVVPFVVNVSE